MEFLVVLFLIVLNGVFAMSELALVSAREARLEKLAEDGNASARVAIELGRNPNRFLSTVQIGITLIGIVAGAFGGASLANTLSEHFGIASSAAVTIVVGIITYLSLVIGELVPKRLALHNPERIALMVASPMKLLSTAAAPLVWFLSQSTSLVLRLLGMRASSEPPISEMEIMALIRQGIPYGVFETREHEMVEAVFRFDEQPAIGLITPRTDIVWLDVNATEEENRQKLTEENFSAYPVCEGSIDNVIGIVQSKDLIRQIIKSNALNLREIMQHPLFIPENVPASDVLEQIKASSIHIAIILGEYGGVEGLLTIHDLLEEFVGEIDADDPEAIQRDDGSWLLNGLLPIHRLQDIFPGITLPENEGGDYHALAGFILSRLGHIPKTGERLEWDGIVFEIVDMDGNRVDKVLAKLTDTAE